MSRRIAWLLLLAGCAAPLAACGNHERLAYDFERMRQQQRYDLYASSNIFPDGKAMQPPPAGTVARETAAEPVLDAAATALPVPVTPALLAEGKQRYTVYCAVCHGDAGYGGSIVAINMGPPRPISLHSAQVRQLPPATLYNVLTLGFGRMPAYDWELTPEQRWAVIAYVQQLQQTGATTAEAVRDSTEAARLHVIDSVAAARQRVKS
jgi:mono/diheme cytochrome c family protein